MAPPVLCYHRIGGPLELGVTRVPRTVFERQMRALRDAGWRALTLSEFAQTVLHQRTTDHARRTFLLTFDDGYASLADTAYPVLAGLGFTATTFLVTDYVGRPNTWDARYTWRRLPHLDWPVIERWRGRGFDFASHTARHARLTWLNGDEAAEELGRSRETLVRRLGAAAGRAVAYPFWAVDGRVKTLARSAGYELGLAGVRGDRADPLELPRAPVYAWDRGAPPLVLRSDDVGGLTRLAAHAASRCALGTSLLTSPTPPLPPPPSPSRDIPCPRAPSHR